MSTQAQERPQAWRQPVRVPDSKVGPRLDAELRDLLSLCFTKPGDEVFQRQRYFRLPPESHWILRTQDGLLAAHVALYPRDVLAGAQRLHIAGIGDVCVRPYCRGQGLVGTILRAAHAELRDQGYGFSLLLGSQDVYGSSDYKRVEQPVREIDLLSGKPKVLDVGSACVCQLGDEEWPSGEIDLLGPLF